MASGSATRHSHSYPEEALGLSYYHPTVTTMREVRDIFLKYLDTSGFYLLRKSFTKSSTLTVSVVFNHSIKHFTISQKETGAFYLQGKQFALIHDLVGYYGKQEVPNKEEIPGIYLKQPVLDLKRQHFFASSFKRQTSGDETKSEARTRHSWRGEKSESRRTDRMDSVKPFSQSFTIKAAPRDVSVSDWGNRKLDGGRNGSTPSRTDVIRAPNSCQDSPYSGYLQLSPTSNSEVTMSVSASRPMSQRDAGAGGCRRRSSGQDPELSDDGTSSNQQPMSPSLQSGLSQDRPPPQKPQDEALSPRCTTTAEGAPRLLYCYARSPYTQLAPSLVQRLREIEGDHAIKCECGIYHDDAELPRGWSFHKSIEPETYGRVLFTGPEGESDWNLPLEVSLELSADQQDRIRNLVCRPPLPQCGHPLDVGGGASGSATQSVSDSGYQTLSR